MVTKETSQWQCRCRLTLPCSIARLWWWLPGCWVLALGMLVGVQCAGTRSGGLSGTGGCLVCWMGIGSWGGASGHQCLGPWLAFGVWVSRTIKTGTVHQI